MTRMRSEAEIDSPTKRRGSPKPYKGFPFTFGSGGSGAVDERALTIDSKPRMSPRCVGLHKGRVNRPADHEKPAKSDTVRALQAWGMGNNSDVDLIEKKRSISGSPDPGNRMKVEVLQAMPLSGSGADISLVGGRRIQGLEMRNRAASPIEAKQRLDDISIEHQFRRRHRSCPPPSLECKWQDDLEHALRAEDYAHLLGRPEGYMRPASMRETPRALSVRPYRCKDPSRVLTSPRSSVLTSPRGEGCREWSSKHPKGFDEDNGSDAIRVPPVMNEPEPEQSTRADQHDAIRNTQAEAVSIWDAMLSAISESPHLFSPKASSRNALNSEVPHLSLPATLAAAIAVSAASGDPVSPPQRTRNASEPTKRRSHEERRDHKSPRRRGRMSRQASDTSVLSATTADTLTAVLSQRGAADLSTGSHSHTSHSHSSSSGSLHSSRLSNKNARIIVADWLRKEHWKARRRAQWVA